MGLFGSKKVFVSSSVKNMAGDVEDRPDYLKSVVAAHTITGDTGSMGDLIRGSYLNGPGINLRSFYRWSRKPENMDKIGIPEGTYLGSNNVDGAELSAAVAAMTGATDILAQIAEIGAADYSYWAEQWLLRFAPNEFPLDWAAEFNEATGKIDITFHDDSIHSFTPTDYDTEAQYIYITYNEDEGDEEYGPDSILIYKIGSGNTFFDNIQEEVSSSSLGSGYFPYIPFRLENHFLSESYYPEAYDQAQDAFRKAFGSRKAYRNIIKQIDEIENLDDVDHAYAVFGPSVNVLDNSARQYIFEFFRRVATDMTAAGYGGTTEANAWVSEVASTTYEREDYADWSEGNLNPASEWFGQPPPSQASSPAATQKKIQIIGSNNLPGQLNMEISWMGMAMTSGTGLAKPGAKKDEVWFSNTLNDTIDRTLITGTTVDPVEIHNYRLYHQIDANNWEAIDFVDLKHRNYIYKGKFVEITLQEALEDAEESGFIIPLNYYVLKDLSLIDSTQLATACCNIVFNSYIVKKVGLLGSLFFKIILAIIVAVVMNIVLPGSGTAAGSSIAASIGITGLAAVVVDAAISLLAAMAISAIVTPVAKAVFGDKLGALIGSLVSFVASVYAGNFINTGSLAVNWGNMMSAVNLTQLTTALGNAYSSYIQASAMGVYQDQQQFMKDMNAKSKELQERFAEEIGYGRAVLDPMMLTESDRPGFESPEMFLSRTLLTGSDIAEMSMMMISEFASATTSTKLPLSG